MGAYIPEAISRLIVDSWSEATLIVLLFASKSLPMVDSPLIVPIGCALKPTLCELVMSPMEPPEWNCFISSCLPMLLFVCAAAAAFLSCSNSAKFLYSFFSLILSAWVN